MTARAIGSATISFGLVSIPVKLYSANQTQAGISFNMLHKKCGSRLRQQYICPTDNEVVGREDTVKGYEFAKGQFVTFNEEEIKALDEVASETVDIAEFVPAVKVDPVYFEKAYYLGPDRGGEKAYRLLAQAMVKTGRCGVARYAARGKQYLVLLRPLEGRLVMQQLRYADEVRPFADVHVPDAEFKEAELALATQLIDQIATEQFSPENYKDTVKERVQALIEKKVNGQQVTAAPPEAPRGQIIDLMEALKASLSAKPAPVVLEAAPKVEAPKTPEPVAAEAAEATEGRKGPKAKAPRGSKSSQQAEKGKSARKVS